VRSRALLQSLSAAHVGLACVLSALAGCNAMMDLDRFSHAAMDGDSGSVQGDGGADAGGGDPNADKDLILVLQRMAPHPDQLMEFRIVDGSNRVQMHGLADPLGIQDLTLRVPAAISPFGGPYRLDFYADMNETRSYDGIGSGTVNDHAWRIPLEASTRRGRTVEIAGNTIKVTFLHDTVFTDIDTDSKGKPGAPADTGLDATVKFTKLPASYQGVPVYVRINNADTGRTVGFYRYPGTKALTPPFSAVIPGVVESQVEYDIAIYIDVNGNLEYDNPASGGPDKGWCLKRSAEKNTGLVFEFDPTLAIGGDCDTGAP
jgi:hypothetical protein